MNRHIVFACLLCNGFTAFDARAEAAPERPNIVWLSTEDIGPDLGCYGSPDAVTPNLDALAARGVRYTRAFTTAPVCAPSRSCIITGVYATTLGTMHMRASGEGAGNGAMPALPPEVRGFPGYLRKAGYYCTNNEKQDYNFAPTPPDTWDESSGKAHWKNRGSTGQPFFAVFNYLGTHEGQVRDDGHRMSQWTEKLTPEQRHDPSRISVPPDHPDTPAVRRQWANYHDLITAMDYWVADHLKELDEAGLADDTIVFFWSDHGAGLPRHKRWVYDSGTHIPLLLYVPDKWQDRLGIHPGVEDRLVSSIDFAPTVLSMAQIAPPDYFQGSVFAGTSAAPPRQYVFSARDRMDERFDTIRSVRDEHFRYVTNFQPWVPYAQYLDYCERGEIQKELRRLAGESALPEGCRWFAVAAKPVEELYDCKADPYSLRNLADDPKYQVNLVRLRKVERHWMTETHDLGLLPEPELNRLAAKFGSRFAIYDGMAKEDPEFWNALSAIAEAASTEGDAQTEVLLQAARSPHAAIRYWAAKGAGWAHVTSGAAEMLGNLRSDPCPEVRIAAADVLLRERVDTAAQWELIMDLLQDEDSWVRLHAAAALDAAGELARPALPALQRALDDNDNKYVVRVANHAVNELLGTHVVVP